MSATNQIRQALAARREADAAIAAACAGMCRQLRERRQAAELTQQDIADAIGLTRVQITNIESGKGASLRAIVGYAAILGHEWTLPPIPDGSR